jgi:hypothetical protein
LKIIRALANATDPDAGEALEADSICRKPGVVKALNKLVAARVTAPERERVRPKIAFRTWTCAEDAQVCEAVPKGTSFEEIAKAHNRTVASIVVRRVRLGKIAAQLPSPRAA